MISIVLATYNESEIIQDMVNELFNQIKDPLEVIVVDDNSPDKTAEVVKQMNNPNVKVIKRLKTKGLATAFNRGIIESRGDIIGWMDADMCMPPSLIPKMVGYLDKYDIVIGSRYVCGGKDLREPIRVVTSKMLNGFAELMLGSDVKDYTSGFVVIKRNVLNEVTLNAKGYGSYFPEFLYHAKKRGLKIKEVGYKFRDRDSGKSKSMPNYFTFLKLGWEYGFRIILTRLRKLK